MHSGLFYRAKVAKAAPQPEPKQEFRLRSILHPTRRYSTTPGLRTVVEYTTMHTRVARIRLNCGIWSNPDTKLLEANVAPENLYLFGIGDFFLWE